MEFNQVTECMLDLLARNADTQQIINTATEIMDNPVLLVDSNFRMLGISTNIEVQNSLWFDSTSKKYISEQVILAMQEERVIENLQNKDEPVIGLVPEGFRCIRMPLHCKGRYRGFLGVYDYHSPFKEGDERRLQIISKAVCAHIQSSPFFNAVKESAYDLFLYELLQSRNEILGLEICNRYTALSFGSTKVVLVFSRGENAGGKTNIPTQLIKSRLETVLFNHHSVEFDGDIVAVVNMDKKPTGMISVLERTLQFFCQENELEVGLSAYFAETEKMNMHYNQALYALRQGIKKNISGNEMDNRLFYYDSYITDYIIDVCLEKHIPDYYIHKIIYQLKEYDEKYKTAYLESLRQYLYHFGNLMEMSVALDVHYNTIKYRIKMVKEITGINLDDVNLKFQLYFSFKILDKVDFDKNLGKESVSF